MQRPTGPAQFGAKVRKIREKKGINQETLAIRAGVDRAHMGVIERGHSDVRVSTQQRIAKALGVTVRSLIDF